MPIAIQNIVIKAFHSFMLFLSMVYLLTAKKSHEATQCWVVIEQHTQERWGWDAKKWRALGKNTVVSLYSCKNHQAATFLLGMCCHFTSELYAMQHLRD